MSGFDAARFLAGSQDRPRLLAHLRSSPSSPRDAADELDLAHRTAQRQLAELADRGWAEKHDGAYRLTTTGALIAAEHGDYLDTLGAIERLEPFYRYLPDADCAPDPRWLRDAVPDTEGRADDRDGDTELVVASPEQPQAPVNHYVTAVSTLDTDRVRMLSSVLSRLFHRAHAELVGRGIPHELVMAVETARRARELNPEEFALVVGFDGLALSCHDDPLGFGLTLGDDRAFLHAYDEDGQLKAIVDTTNPAVLDWASDLFERVRADARPIDSPADLDRPTTDD